MASISKHRGSFTVRWWTLGGQQQRRTCPTVKSANELKRDIEEAHAVGHEWKPAAEGGEPEIEAVAAAYLRERSLLKAAPGTIRVARSHLDLFIRFLRSEHPRGRLHVSLLGRPLMMDFLSWLLEPGTSRHGKVARASDSAVKIVSAAELMWTWAEESDRWPGLVPRPRRVDFTKSAPKRVVAPTWAEMDACVLACRGWHRALAFWLRSTGLRVGESMLFLWSDVDLERGLLDIRPEVDKNGIGRVVPLSPLVLDEIATWGKREGYLIRCNRRPGVREREARGRDMNRAWKRAGVRERPSLSAASGRRRCNGLGFLRRVSGPAGSRWRLGAPPCPAGSI